MNQAEHGWEEFLPVADKATKLDKGDTGAAQQAIFKLYSLGVVTNRDEWVYGHEAKYLTAKLQFLIETYNEESRSMLRSGSLEFKADSVIKWTRAVKRDLENGVRYKYSKSKIRDCLYRPFVKLKLYFDPSLNEVQYQMPQIFSEAQTDNFVIAFNVNDSSSVLASKYLIDLHFNGDSQCLPLYRYKGGERIDNITDFAIKAFRVHYQNASITREQVFHYVYAVLHHPAYREKYALNLRQEFPRVPFYEDFGRWAAWGERLLRLHVDFETAQPFPLTRVEVPPKNGMPEALALAQKAKLKADKAAGELVLDGLTTLRSVPPEAWAYRLGNRSALEWVLERHKETTPRDPTIRERFNTYRFADHKERVVDLLARVTTVSVETMRVLGEMPGETV